MNGKIPTLEDAIGMVDLARREAASAALLVKTLEGKIDTMEKQYRRIEKLTTEFSAMKGSYDSLLKEMDGITKAAIEREHSIEKNVSENTSRLDNLEESLINISMRMPSGEETTLANVRIEDLHSVGDVLTLLRSVLKEVDLVNSKMESVYKSNKKAGRVTLAESSKVTGQENELSVISGK